MVLEGRGWSILANPWTIQLELGLTGPTSELTPAIGNESQHLILTRYLDLIS